VTVRHLLRFALASLFTNSLRTMLAVLGIVIGVAAVIAMIGLGRGAERQATAQITALGSNLLFVRPGFGPRQMVRTATAESLTLEDAEALAALPNVVAAIPEVGLTGQVKFYAANTSTSVVGTTMAYFESRGFQLAAGRLWNDVEERSRARVCVLGAAVATTLFGEAPAVGQRIKVRGVAFEVIGQLLAKGGSGFANPDEQLLCPLVTAQKRLGASDHLRSITIQAASSTTAATVQADSEALLRQRHQIVAGRDPDFTITNQLDILRTRSEIAQTFTLLLAGIALVSLVVGGIGIMNIMLVSVAERTREIGILKAIGARRRDIQRQFLVEAVVICLVGGGLGVALGAGAALAIDAWVPQLPMVVAFDAIAVSFSFACVTGVFFGWYPASRAAALNPIEALRHE
jgi:putative ABC transport system permease protein